MRPELVSRFGNATGTAAASTGDTTRGGSTGPCAVGDATGMDTDESNPDEVCRQCTLFVGESILTAAEVRSGRSVENGAKCGSVTDD